MDSFDVGTFKLEKARTLQRSNIRRIASFFRVIELCIVLILISRLSTQVPFTVKNCGEYFRGLKVVLVSPVSVFVLGNVIVVTLIAKSGRFFAHDPAVKIDYFYEQCAEKSQMGENREADARERKKTYKRARSEKLGRNRDEKLRRAPHRSKSEKCMKGSEETAFIENAMSNEEFRQTIEDFIARQQKFRMEEDHYAT